MTANEGRTGADVVSIDQRARRAWPWLPDAARPGSVWVGPCGERVRVREDGTAVEVGEVPRRWSGAADPCAGEASRKRVAPTVTEEGTMINPEMKRTIRALGLVDALGLDGTEAMFAKLTMDPAADLAGQLRRFALDHPEHLRDPAALRLSPAEAHEHLSRLVADRRMADAARFKAVHGQAIEVGRAVAERDARAAADERARTEHRAERHHLEATRLDSALRERAALLSTVERTGAWPENYWNGVGRPPPPPTPADVGRIKAEILDLTEKRAALGT